VILVAFAVSASILNKAALNNSELVWTYLQSSGWLLGALLAESAVPSQDNGLRKPVAALGVFGGATQSLMPASRGLNCSFSDPFSAAGICGKISSIQKLFYKVSSVPQKSLWPAGVHASATTWLDDDCLVKLM
jgi:hypothetical protein